MLVQDHNNTQKILQSPQKVREKKLESFFWNNKCTKREVCLQNSGIIKQDWIITNQKLMSCFRQKVQVVISEKYYIIIQIPKMQQQVEVISFYTPFNNFFPHFQCQPIPFVEETYYLKVHIEAENQIKSIPISQSDLKEAGYTSPKKRWTQEEDRKLLKLTKTPEINWEEISKFFQDRNPKMCYNRYRRLCCMIERSWTTRDDKKIAELVKEHGENWRILKQYFPGKNEKQLKDRYNNHLRPELDKSDWDLKTDLQFVRLLSQFGCDWTQIQKQMPERSYPQIKNRYYGRIAKIIAKKLKLELRE